MSHDFPAYGLAPRKEDIVKMLPQQAGVFRPAARDDRDIAFIKTFCYDAADDPAGGRGVGAGFKNHGISCRQCVYQGVEGQQEGIIPGTHNQHCAVRGRLLETP